MNKEEAMAKAAEKVENGEIPFECAEAAKSHVGQSFRFPTGVAMVTDWIGQNYVLEIGGQYAVLPVMWLIDKIRKNIIKEAGR